MLTLTNAVRRAEMEPMQEEELWAAIEDVRRQQQLGKLMSATRCGELIELTAAERDVCRITTMEACDETKLERQTRRAAERRARDREAKKEARNCLPRTIYERTSQSRQKPWEKEGVSRATYYRCRQHKPS
jgi:hypothetical protein